MSFLRTPLRGVKVINSEHSGFKSFVYALYVYIYIIFSFITHFLIVIIRLYFRNYNVGLCI